ncbi:hypothetical protein [Luteithermobacter gelatinilyticus]|uniref:hypothetical protein n=1 Tax=Luteithermobacter gelatinilyticus TaxID=2582913 RepID=UPI001105F476|nr:hypothetical protein [Luteithermobacter gelatinilyticus]
MYSNGISGANAAKLAPLSTKLYQQKGKSAFLAATLLAGDILHPHHHTKRYLKNLIKLLTKGKTLTICRFFPRLVL